MESAEASVRAATVDDARAIAAIYAHYVERSVASFEEVAPDIGEVAHRMTSGGMPWLVSEIHGAVVGYAYAGPHNPRAAYRWAVNVSVYLHPDATGHGLGRALYRELLPDLVTRGYVMACAGITLPNVASVKLHETFGFSSVGIYPMVGFKHGAWYDVGWWQLQLAARPASPVEPLRASL